MKKISIVLIICVLMTFSACGSKVGNTLESKTAQAPISHEANSGYFEDVVKEIKDQFGETTGEEHAIAASVSSHDSYGKDRGVVSVRLNYPGYYKNISDYSFVFTLPAPNQKVLVQHIAYKIDDVTYQVDQGSLNSKKLPQDYSRVCRALLDGKDVLFSIDDSVSGNAVFHYIFTIHGEGFADLLEKILLDIPTYYRWNELEPIQYGMVHVQFGNNGSSSLGQYSFMATAGVENADTLLSLFTSDYHDPRFDQLISVIQRTIDNGNYIQLEGIRLYSDVDSTTGATLNAFTYETDEIVTIGLYSDIMEGITHYFEGQIN